MAFSSIRSKAPKLYYYYVFPCIHQNPQSVRRNASSVIWPVQRLFFSSESSRTGASVQALLKDYGFSETQISKLRKKSSPIFNPNAATNIEPKLKFLGSIGLSRAELPSIVLRNTSLLVSSLENQIVPAHNYLQKDVPLSNAQILRATRYYPFIFTTRMAVLVPNIELLRNMRLPLSSIAALVVLYARTLCRNHEAFKAAVEQVVAMGLDPLKQNFVMAIHVIRALTKENWERKLELYRSFGMSEDEFLQAFRVFPWVMTLSEKKIVKSMEFFLNELKWAPAVVARFPTVLCFDLERRTIPRCHVMEMLKERGLAQRCSAMTMLTRSEKEFFKTFIMKYEDEFPELLDAYNSLRSRSSKQSQSSK